MALSTGDVVEIVTEHNIFGGPIKGTKGVIEIPAHGGCYVWYTPTNAKTFFDPKVDLKLLYTSTYMGSPNPPGRGLPEFHNYIKNELSKS